GVRRRKVAIGEPFLVDRIGHGFVRRQPLRLLVEFVPTEVQPRQPFEDRIERGFGIPLYVRIVDAQNEGAVIVSCVQPVEDESARAADMQKPCRRGRKTNSEHGNLSITASRDAPLPGGQVRETRRNARSARRTVVTAQMLFLRSFKQREY